jgi:hypothetical protein
LDQLIQHQQALMNGFIIGNEDVLTKLIKVEKNLAFNQRSNTKRGFLSGIKLVPVLNQVANAVVETKKMIKTMPVEINKLHRSWGAVDRLI